MKLYSVQCKAQNVFGLISCAKGTVLAVLDGEDGDPGTTYQVEYLGEGTYEVDHLIEDFEKGELKFGKHFGKCTVVVIMLRVMQISMLLLFT